MPRDQVRMPSSSAGVLSFYDEEKSTFVLKPSHVVILCALVTILLIVFNYTGLFR